MGKIVVVDKEGDIVNKRVQEKVFEVLRAALVPGVRDLENRKLIEILDDIKINKEISKKYQEILSFYRTFEVSDVRDLMVIFSYNPADKSFAKIYIFSCSREGIDRLFCGLFSDSDDPDQTTLLIEDLQQPSLWLPELKLK